MEKTVRIYGYSIEHARNILEEKLPEGYFIKEQRENIGDVYEFMRY